MIQVISEAAWSKLHVGPGWYDGEECHYCKDPAAETCEVCGCASCDGSHVTAKDLQPLVDALPKLKPGETIVPQAEMDEVIRQACTPHFDHIVQRKREEAMREPPPCFCSDDRICGSCIADGHGCDVGKAFMEGLAAMPAADMGSNHRRQALMQGGTMGEAKELESVQSPEFAEALRRACDKEAGDGQGQEPRGDLGAEGGAHGREEDRGVRSGPPDVEAPVGGAQEGASRSGGWRCGSCKEPLDEHGNCSCTKAEGR